MTSRLGHDPSRCVCPECRSANTSEGQPATSPIGVAVVRTEAISRLSRRSRFRLWRYRRSQRRKVPKAFRPIFDDLERKLQADLEHALIHGAGPVPAGMLLDGQIVGHDQQPLDARPLGTVVDVTHELDQEIRFRQCTCGAGPWGIHAPWCEAVVKCTEEEGCDALWHYWRCPSHPDYDR